MRHMRIIRILLASSLAMSCLVWGPGLRGQAQRFTKEDDDFLKGAMPEGHQEHWDKNDNTPQNLKPVKYQYPPTGHPMVAPPTPKGQRPTHSVYWLDPPRFFKEMGEYADHELNKNGINATNKVKAQKVLAEIGEVSQAYNLIAHTKGRSRAVQGATGTCGWWKDNLTIAFEGAGIPRSAIHSVESYVHKDEDTRWSKNYLDVNRVHTSIMVTDNDDKLYTFDAWQYGADKDPAIGWTTIAGVGGSEHNGMPIGQWFVNQKKAGRPWKSIDQNLVDTSPFIHDLLDAVKGSVSEDDIKKFGGRGAFHQWLLEQVIKFVTEKGSCDVNQLKRTIQSQIANAPSNQKDDENTGETGDDATELNASGAMKTVTMTLKFEDGKETCEGTDAKGSVSISGNKISGSFSASVERPSSKGEMEVKGSITVRISAEFDPNDLQADKATSTGSAGLSYKRWTGYMSHNYSTKDGGAGTASITISKSGDGKSLKVTGDFKAPLDELSASSVSGRRGTSNPKGCDITGAFSGEIKIGDGS